MGEHGGAREGAGRKAGVKNQRTQELIAKATENGITPMEVLLNDMRFFYNLSQNKMMEAQSFEPGKEQAKAFRAALSLKDIARNCAIAAAPYVHPKLSSIQANVVIADHERALAELE